MTNTPGENAVSVLYGEVRRIKSRLPSSRWFLFGSAMTAKSPVGDVDLLVVCNAAADCTTVRTELESICTRFPIHLLLMTPEEEAEVQFIESEHATEIA
jgi:hypothetical protein